MASTAYGYDEYGFNSRAQKEKTQGFAEAAMKGFGSIGAPVRNHLKRVYLALCVCLAAAAVGATVHVYLNLGGLLTAIACIASIFWFLSVPPTLQNEQKRLGILVGAAALQGASIGPLIDVALDLDPMILLVAFVGTSLSFACFSAAALFAKRREFLYLGGLLSSGLSILLWVQLASMVFGGSWTVYMFELYFGLLVFVGYVIFDTQMIIERAEGGEMDYMKHSLELFTDFVSIFVRILTILAKNAEKKNESKKKKRT